MNEQKAQRLSVAVSSRPQTSLERNDLMTSDTNTRLSAAELELIELGKKHKEKLAKEKARRAAYDARPDRQAKRSEYNKKRYAEQKSLKMELKGLSLDDVKRLLQLARATTEVEQDLADEDRNDD